MRIVIVVEGGVVQGVYASRLVRKRMRVQLVDWDNIEAGEAGAVDLHVDCIETAARSLKDLAYE